MLCTFVCLCETYPLQLLFMVIFVKKLYSVRSKMFIKCLESIYWHCFEKWFCYDESIALYQDPDGYPDKQLSTNIDTMCYWDSVSVIAGRNIVTIQPLPEDKKNQPLLTIKKTAETKEDISSEPLQEQKNIQKTFENKPINKTLDNVKKNFRLSTESHNSKLKNDLRISSSLDRIHTKEKKVDESNLNSQNIFTISLPKLDDNNYELKLIRQESMPNFFVETPTISNSPLSWTPDVALMSPVLPNTPQFTYDLRSIVEIEKSKCKESESKTDVNSSNTSGRLLMMRKKLTPLVIKPTLQKVPSSKNIS